LRLVLLGPPGAGKGTQAQYLISHYGIPQISTGGMLRDAAERGTSVGLDARRYTDQGQLVPDPIVVDLVLDRLRHNDLSSGYLLDGFPRTVSQAQSLDDWLAGQNEKLDAAVNLQVDDNEIIQRISCRRVCPQCHESYHLLSRPPRVDENCDACGQKLVLREDDRPEVVRERLNVYHSRTEPVLDYYRRRGLLIEIDGKKPVRDVTAAIVAALKDRTGGRR